MYISLLQEKNILRGNYPLCPKQAVPCSGILAITSSFSVVGLLGQMTKLIAKSPKFSVSRCLHYWPGEIDDF